MSFPGFDCSLFPGLDAMRDLKAASNLLWCGYYLAPAPSHADTSWLGQREALDAQGWGFAVIYVGQQVIGPGSKKTTATQGEKDGADAALLMEREGFLTGTYVYLDLENGDPFTPQQSEYVKAWCAEVESAGYEAGVYCSWRIADGVARLVPRARLWCFRVLETDEHEVGGTTFPTPVPASCGVANAYAWQREQNAWISFPGEFPSEEEDKPPQPGIRRLLVDLSVCIFPAPSRP